MTLVDLRTKFKTWWRRKRCEWGIHDAERAHVGFTRRCCHCKTWWIADYFDWRQRRYPIWHSASDKLSKGLEAEYQVWRKE